MGLPFPFNQTSALASVTDRGSTCVASKSTLLKIAIGTLPFEPTLMLFGKLPGLMSMLTSIVLGTISNT